METARDCRGSVCEPPTGVFAQRSRASSKKAVLVATEVLDQKGKGNRKKNRDRKEEEKMIIRNNIWERMSTNGKHALRKAQRCTVHWETAKDLGSRMDSRTQTSDHLCTECSSLFDRGSGG